jgi:molecular chaperone DnaK
VSAKDKGTGKEQSMTITGGSSLSTEDIERMIREAEEHANDDHARREAAEKRNVAEQMVYSVDKVLDENADKLSEDLMSEVRGDVDALKTALAGTDDAAVDSAVERLQASQGKIGEAIYAAQDAPSDDSAEAPADDEDIIDAEVVDDEDDKNDDKGDKK